MTNDDDENKSMDGSNSGSEDSKSKSILNLQPIRSEIIVEDIEEKLILRRLGLFDSSFSLDYKNIIELRNRINKLIKKDVKEFWSKPKTNDDNDFSAHPSYTNLKPPYTKKCRVRYAKTWQMYDEQFRNELIILRQNLESSYEQVRLTRVFGVTTMWPPLHTRTEINRFVNKFFVYTPKERKRLSYLLDNVQECI